MILQNRHMSGPPYELHCRLDETIEGARALLEEERRLDELELHDAKRTVVVSDDVDAAVEEVLRGRGRDDALGECALLRSDGHFSRDDLDAAGEARRLADRVREGSVDPDEGA